MKRGLVLVEGQTEERFVNECLAPYLLERGTPCHADDCEDETRRWRC